MKATVDVSWSLIVRRPARHTDAELVEVETFTTPAGFAVARCGRR